MGPALSQPPRRIEQLARAVEEDIRRRGLGVGEAYLTAAEVAELLGVHLRQASRAMEVLGRKRLLVRRRGVGTFVGPAMGARNEAALRCVHVLVTGPRFQSGLGTSEILAGLRQELPRHDVQFNFVPAEAPLEYVRQVLERGAADGSLSGLVLISCPRPIQELVRNQRTPAVVFGGVYPTTADLPSVDADQEAIGRLMAEYLLKRGHRRMALLARELWLPGDNRMVDGVSRALAAAKLGQGSLIIRSVSAEPAAVEAEVESLLGMREMPTAIMCRSNRFAAAAQRVIRSFPPRVARRIEVICGGSSDTPAPADLPRIETDKTFAEQAAIVGSMLKNILTDRPPDPLRVTIDVKLVVP